MIELFPSFFRSTQSNKGYWAAGTFFGGKKRSGRTIPERADETFKQVWSKLMPIINNGEPVDIWQFLIVTSIIINETGGTFVPVSEYGGLKYMFGTNGGKKKNHIILILLIKPVLNFLMILYLRMLIKTYLIMNM